VLLVVLQRSRVAPDERTGSGPPISPDELQLATIPFLCTRSLYSARLLRITFSVPSSGVTRTLNQCRKCRRWQDLYRTMAQSALIIAPTVYERHRPSLSPSFPASDKPGTPTTTTGTGMTTITQNGRPDEPSPACRAGRTRSSKSFIHPRGKVHSRGHVCRADRHCKRGIYALSATRPLSLSLSLSPSPLLKARLFTRFLLTAQTRSGRGENAETERDCFDQKPRWTAVIRAQLRATKSEHCLHRRDTYTMMRPFRVAFPRNLIIPDGLSSLEVV